MTEEIIIDIKSILYDIISTSVYVENSHNGAKKLCPFCCDWNRIRNHNDITMESLEHKHGCIYTKAIKLEELLDD